MLLWILCSQYRNVTAFGNTKIKCNRESGLHIQLVMNEPKAFDGFMAHYGKFSGVTNYIALIGKKNADLEEKCGYHGERPVLKALLPSKKVNGSMHKSIYLSDRENKQNETGRYYTFSSTRLLIHTPFFTRIYPTVTLMKSSA